MKNEEYYNKIKKSIYLKFEALDFEDLGHTLYLRKKGTRYTEIGIFKKSGEVFYAYGFSEKIFKYFALKKIDFEIFLKMWVEDKFKIKVTDVVRMRKV